MTMAMANRTRQDTKFNKHEARVKPTFYWFVKAGNHSWPACLIDDDHYLSLGPSDDIAHVTPENSRFVVGPFINS